jgi:ribonuclease/clavin/mitogillin
MSVLNIVNVGYDSTNYYLIQAARASLLVDVGFPGTMPKLRHALKRAGSALSAIGYLLVTHYHVDHAGLAEELKGEGVKLIVLEHQLPAIPLLKRQMKPAYGYREIALDDAVIVAVDKSRSFLRGIGVEGEIIATPGHSDDSVSLVLDTGMAFTGDLPPPNLDETNQDLQRSWAALQARSVRVVYPGHGSVIPLSVASGNSCD